MTSNVKKLIQQLEFLRYPNEIVIESFDEPNFQLVADILYWLCLRFDLKGRLPIHDSIETEQDRIKFITSIVHAFCDVEQDNIILDAKQLYLAMDGAVEEILKITSYLVDAIHFLESNRKRSNSSSSGITTRRGLTDNDAKSTITNLVDINRVRNLRTMLSQVLEDCSKLNDVILKMSQDTARQDDLRLAINYFDEVSSTTKDDSEEVKQVMHLLNSLVEEKKQELLQLEDSNSLLQAKLSDTRESFKMKSRELERNKTRLKNLRSVRPDFVQEIEKIEIDVQMHYELYMERYRNLHFLKSDLEEIKRVEEKTLLESQRNMKNIQIQMHQEDVKMTFNLGEPTADLSIDENEVIIDQNDSIVISSASCSSSSSIRSEFGSVSASSNSIGSDFINFSTN